MTDVYKVKSWTYLYDAIAAGIKTHDIRDMRDRNYKVGDILILQRYDMSTGQYTGEEQGVEITYITSNEVPCAFSSAVLDKNFAVLSVRKLSREDAAIAWVHGQIRNPQLYDGAFGNEIADKPLHS